MAWDGAQLLSSVPTCCCQGCTLLPCSYFPPCCQHPSCSLPLPLTPPHPLYLGLPPPPPPFPLLPLEPGSLWNSGEEWGTLWASLASLGTLCPASADPTPRPESPWFCLARAQLGWRQGGEGRGVSALVLRPGSPLQLGKLVTHLEPQPLPPTPPSFPSTLLH